MMRFLGRPGILALVVVLTACKQPAASPRHSPVGDVITHLSFGLGSVWGAGYSIDVLPGRMIVVESRACSMGKLEDRETGFCVIPITREQSDRLEAAMSRFKQYAIPLQTVDLHADWRRPDGQRCKSHVTDADLLTLTWTSTKGIDVAAFYTGCDEDELKDFYGAVRALVRQLPVEQVVPRD